jgi:hypothetical protein
MYLLKQIKIPFSFQVELEINGEKHTCLLTPGMVEMLNSTGMFRLKNYTN